MTERVILTHEDANLHRDDGICSLIVTHSMECPMQGGRALSWSGFLHNNPWPFFAHDYYDPIDHIRVVSTLDVKVAHCGNGNTYRDHRSIGREHAGYAAQPRETWLSPAGLSMLNMSAYDTAADCKRWAIPPTFVDGPGLVAGQRGITTHNLCSRYLHGSTHTDPGDNFPMDIYVGLVKVALARLNIPTVTTGDKMAELWQHPVDHRLEYTFINPASGALQTSWELTENGKWVTGAATIDTTHDGGPANQWGPNTFAGSVKADLNFNWRAQNVDGAWYKGWYDERKGGWHGPIPA